MPTFSDLARAAYCPRQLYYARREDEADRGPPPEARARRDLAFRYPELREATDDDLEALPLDVDPETYRARLDELARRPDWESLADPERTMVRLDGKDCRGVAHKVLGGDPPTPTLASPGTPPERGVWEPQAVRAVATAKALAWEHERAIPRAYVEYPAVGVVRTVRLTVRRVGTYRRVLRAVRSLDGPPSRIHDDAKCGACEYRGECGVETRSLRSMLGL